MPVIGQVLWQHLTQPEFDRIVEMLLVRYHQERGEHATALDGRGGDGGRDVDVHTGPEPGELDTIYQLKFFPEGFSGAHGRARRPQIERSFEKAMKDKPRQWVLVVPRNVAPKERSWVRSLAKKRKIEVTIWGRAKLDAELSLRPDLLSAATRDALVDTLRIIGQEKAALVGPTDLADRLHDLHSLADGRSAFWGTEFSVDAHGQVTETLVAKRPDAHLHEPIVHTFAIIGDRLGEKERSALELVANFGIGSVELPPEAVTDLKTEGPHWAPRPGVNDYIHLGGRPRMNDPVVLRTLDADKITMQSVRGFVVDVGHGATGRGLVLECAGGLKVTLLFNDNNLESTALVNQALVNENAQDALSAIEFIESASAAVTLEVLRGSSVLVSLRTGPEAGTTIPSAPVYERQLIEDLALISASTRIPLDIPPTLTADERREIRRLRLILEGRAIIEPMFGQLTSTVREDLPESMRYDLSKPFSVALVTTVAYTVLGHVIPVKDAVVYHPRALGTYVDSDQSTAPTQMVVRGVRDDPFWVYAPGRLPVGEEVLLAPLDIPGFSEPPLPDYTGDSDQLTG